MIDPDDRETMDRVLVMMVGDNKAYQKKEWQPGQSPMGDPDIMMDSDGKWTYRINSVVARFKEL